MATKKPPNSNNPNNNNKGGSGNTNNNSNSEGAKYRSRRRTPKKEGEKKISEEERKLKEQQEKEEREKEARRKELEEYEKRKKEREEQIEQLNNSVAETNKKLKEFYEEKKHKRKQREEYIESSNIRSANTLKGLESTIKRTTALTKKIKQAINEENVENICKEVTQLNLSRYVSEIVTGIADIKPKSNVLSILRICLLMHSRYSEFSASLIPKLTKLFENSPTNETEQEKKEKNFKKKETVKLLVELFLSGVYNDPSIFSSILQQILDTTKSHLSDDELALHDLMLFISFTRSASHELLGIPPPYYFQLLKYYQQLRDIPPLTPLNLPSPPPDSQPSSDSENKPEATPSDAVPAEEQETIAEQKEENQNESGEENKENKEVEDFREKLDEEIKQLDETKSLIEESIQQQFNKIIEDYFNLICKHAVAQHKKLRETERENQNILNTKGELTEELSQSYQKQFKSFERLINNLNTFSELIQKEMPQMKEDNQTTRINSESNQGGSDSQIRNQIEEEGIFGDEDTRSFYEDLPNLRELLPPILFGESDPSKSAQKASEIPSQPASTVPNPSIPPAAPAPAAPSTPSAPAAPGTEPANPPTTATAENTEKPATEEVKVGTEKKNTKLDSLISKLPKCVNRELIDSAAMEFCYINSKNNRKKLAKALFNVPRTELVLIPYYSRLIATLNQVYADIGPLILTMLEDEFNQHVQKKDQINIETKVRNIRFISELTLFRVAPVNVTLNCLQVCLDDFMHHNIEVTCNLLETCGRFLYRSPETHIRTNNLLDTMLRLKNVKTLDNRMENMIENAYYYCKPPERAAKKKSRTEIQEYIRKLIFNDLSYSTIKNVLRLICKLNWKEHGRYLVKCILNLKNISYSNISILANLVSSFSNYNAHIGIQVVDLSLYSFYRSLSEEDVSEQQQRVMNVKFISELYCYGVVESPIIFDMLYSLIYHPQQSSTSFNLNAQQQPQPTEFYDCFRVRLICTIISTCKVYFDKGTIRKKFERFIVHFQYYYLNRPFIPYDIEFMVADTLDGILSKFKRFTSLDDAQKAYEKLRKEEEAKKMIPFSIDQFHITSNPHFSNNMDELEDTEDESSTLSELSATVPTASADQPIADPYARTTFYNHSNDNESKANNQDDEFDELLNNMVKESLAARKTESRPVMAIPMNMFCPPSSKSNSMYEDSTTDQNASKEPPKELKYRLLMKKGSKQTAFVMIPAESPLVANRDKVAEWKEERQDIKRKVLEYEEREEDEAMINSLGFFSLFFSVKNFLLLKFSFPSRIYSIPNNKGKGYFKTESKE